MISSKSNEEIHSLSPANEVKLRFADGEEPNYPRITFSTPNKVNVQLFEESTSTKGDDRKRVRKSIDENQIRKKSSQAKKESSAISNIIHRFTWGRFGTANEQEKKEDKHKNEPEVDVPKDEIDRPDKLQLPDQSSGDNVSTDMRNTDFQV